MDTLLNEIVASCVVKVDLEGSPPLNVAISIARPRKVADGTSFECLYRLMGIQCGSFIRSAHGKASLQALFTAMRNINAIVNTLPHQYQFEIDQLFGPAQRNQFDILPDVHEGLAAYRRLDAIETLRRLKPYAEWGIPEFQLIVGDIYRLDAASPNRADAFAWLKRAADQGNGQAYFALAEMCSQSPDRDARQIAEYRRKAIEGGFLLAAAASYDAPA